MSQVELVPRVAVRLAILTGIPALVVALVGGFIGVTTDSVTTGVVVRAVLVTMLLTLGVRAAEHSDEPVPLVTIVIGLIGGYAIDLAWWGGHAYGAQLLLGSGWPAAIADLFLWVAVGAGTAWWAARG